MQIQYNSNTMPLRRKSPGSLSGGAVFNYFCGGFYFYAVIAFIVVIGTSIYVDNGMRRSLSQPMIRKSANYLTQLADDMEGGQPSMNIDAGRISGRDAKKRKSRLFLHVGPQKTGSSTFQSMLDKLTGLTDELKDDNLYYRHIMPEAGDFDCELGEWGGYHNCKASSTLKAVIRKARDEGKDLLLTDENLGEDFVTGLRDAIDDKDWDVTVIVMYRRIHEWLVSWYNQINKTTNKDSEGNILYNEYGIPYRTEHTKWPDQGGAHVPSFSTWYEKYTRYFDATELANKHRSVEYFNLYNEAFDNVLLYNLHEEGSMVTNFLCNIIGATHACGRIKSHQIDIRKVNRSVHLDHDIVSVYAHEQGLVTKTLTRTEIVDAVTTFVKETGKAVPRKCDPKIIEEIRNWLVETEIIMVGRSEWSNSKERKLLTMFDSFVATGKMCDLDKEAILEDKGWRRFFRSIGGKDRGNILLHVGPIGGDKIYETLTTLSGEDQALQKDNYELMDIDIHSGDYFDCTEVDCRATPKLKSMFSSLVNTGKNIIISNDNLEDKFVKGFQEAIDEEKWDVKVVVGYTRLNQLLVMMYEREYNYDDLDPNARLLLGQNDSLSKDMYHQWPNEGGTPIPSFNKWFDAFTEDLTSEKIVELSSHPRNAYVSSFDDVDFFAYNQRSNLVRNFICHMVPGAAQTCQALKTAEAENSNKITTGDDYAEADILAVHAYEKGLVRKGATRETVREAITTKLRSLEKPLSRICASKMTKQLYDWMIESEKTIIGDKFTSKRIAWINQDLQHFLESGKPCALDVEKELQDQMWISFFRDRVGTE